MSRIRSVGHEFAGDIPNQPSLRCTAIYGTGTEYQGTGVDRIVFRREVAFAAPLGRSNLTERNRGAGRQTLIFRRRRNLHVWLLSGLQIVLRYSSSRRIVRTCVRPLYATHLGRGPLWRTSLRVQNTTMDSLWSGVVVWFSRSRPCDRLLHMWPRNSPLSASSETPSANSVPGSASGVYHQFSLVFIPPSSREAA